MSERSRATLFNEHPNFNGNTQDLSLVETDAGQIHLHGKAPDGQESNLPIERANNGSFVIKKSQIAWPIVLDENA